MFRFFSIALCCLAGVAAAQAGLIHDNGAPSLDNGFEMTHWREADQFTIGEPAIVGHFRFWEIDAIAASYAGSIYWEIRANSPLNKPGVLLYSGLETNPTRAATGRLYFEAYPEYVNTFSIPFVALPAGTYWLQLHNGPLSNNVTRDIFWETAINPIPVPSVSDEAPFLGNWLGNGASSKLAFQVFGLPAPRITDIAKISQVPYVTFTTAIGGSYSVEYKESGGDAPWTPLPDAQNVAGTGSPVTVSDLVPNPGDLPRRFYRVTMQGMPPPPPAPSLATPAVRLPFLPLRLPNGDAPKNSLKARLP